MRGFFIIGLFLVGLNSLAQNGLNAESGIQLVAELPGGVITGQVKTYDNQPAAYVSITLKESHKITTTDENGFFTLKNLKEGVYTLEISMVGLKSQQKIIEVKKDAVSNISIVLVEDARHLNDIVITSGRKLNNKPLSLGKIEIDPMDLPQSLTIIGQGLIREQQSMRLSDIMKNVNGVYLATTRASTQENFSARGYAFGNNNLFRNGARLNSGSMPEMSSLESVEILKGSAAILYGQVAPGGIVNMVTKSPKFQAGGEVSMRAGSYDLYKPSFDVYGPITSSIAYRVNGVYETAGSFRDQVSSKRYYVNPSLRFKLGERTELNLDGDHLYNEFTPDFGIGSIDNTKLPDVPRSRFMGTSWQYNKINQSTLTLGLKHAFSESWKINTLISYQKFDRDYYAVERIQAKPNGDWERPLGRILSDESYYTGQVNLNGKFNTASLEHTLLLGVDADHSLTTNNDFRFPVVAGLAANGYDVINILDPGKYTQRKDIPEATMIRRREAPVNRYGIYVQDLVKLSSKFNLLAGVRLSYVETKGIDSTNLLTNAQVTGKGRYDNAFSPRFGIVYKPTETTSLFTSYSNSFVVNSGQDITGSSLRPSLIDQYELGVKNEFWNGKLSANLTLYRIINNNLAQTAPFLQNGTPNNNTNIKMLTGQTTSDGLELDLASHPFKGLNITAGYSFNYMRYTKTDTTMGSFKTGERLVNTPAHTANFTAFYTFHESILKGLKLGTTVVHIGERIGGWNTDVNGINPVRYRSRSFPVKGFTTIDLSAGYNYKKIGVQAKVSNITNALNYYVHENYSINPIPPTQFVATVSYKF